MNKEKTPIIIYQTEDGITKIETHLEDETVWLTQEQMAVLFAKGRSTITEHIYNVFKEGELEENMVCREFRHTTQHGAIKGKTQEKFVKHYLNETELDTLNRMVTAYLDVAELQAINRKPMYMKDWINKLDDFIKMTGNTILDNAGTVSHEQALQKADAEYEKYKEQKKNELSEVEKHFVKQIENTAKKLKSKK